jgi:subtilisin-like proprotein convertase family protein
MLNTKGLHHRTRLGILLSAVMLAAFLGASLRPSQTAQALTHTQTGDITIPTSGVASPYPSTVFVQGEPGLITDIDIRLVGLSHTYPDDLDIVLEHEPSGVTVLIMSDACGSDDLNNATILFDDQSPNGLLPDSGCSSSSGFFYHRQPTNYGAGDSLVAPAPTSGYSSTLSAFTGLTPNGQWRLWVYDDSGSDSGLLSEWRLEITAGTSAIVIPGGSPSSAGNANPYPYNINISGRTGLITDVNVTVSRLSHTWPTDIDMLLVSPDGDKVLLMADACGTDDIRSITLTFDQSAANTLPGSSCTTGTFRPTSGTFNGGAPAPAGPYGTSLNDFNGENPNGTWRVYIYDDGGDDTGFIVDGITLTITTSTSNITIPSSGKAAPYPFDIVISGFTGVVADVNVNIIGFTHTFPDDVDMLLVSPNGIAVVLMSDACGGNRVTNLNLSFNDEIGSGPSANLPDSGTTCTTGTYRPSNYSEEEVFPAPAPGLPYHDRLSVFDGIDPNGTWRLYVTDDQPGDTGFITNVTLNIGISTSMPNIVANGNFGSGETNWNEFGDGSGSVVSGVYQFQRTGSNAFTVFQNTGINWPIDRPFELRFDAGNSGTDTKRLTVLIWDAAFARQRACSFWLGPNQPLTSYQILGDSAAPWNSVTVHFYASTQSTNGFYRLDNVVLRERPDLPSDGTATMLDTLCIDPNAPSIPSGSDSANLLNNPDFATLPGGNANETWGAFGNIAVNLSAGALRMQQTGVPAGSILQNTNVAFPTNSVIEFQVDLGNSHATNWQRVTILLHNENFNGLQFCTFWIPPNTTLQTYVMRTFANSTWNADGISASIYPSTNSQWILVDNTILRRRYIKVIGTGCYEPGSMQPAMDDLAWMQELEAAQEMLPELLPTQVPYSPPGAPMEIPLLVSPADYQPEAESSAEGTITEGSAGE